MQSTEQRPLSQRTARDLVLLIALTLAVHLPFIDQAFHLDDVQYLDVARNVFRNPVFPLDLQSVFEGKHVTLWAHSHPPLNSYVIAGLLRRCFVRKQEKAGNDVRVERRMRVGPQRDVLAFENRLKIQGNTGLRNTLRATSKY